MEGVKSPLFLELAALAKESTGAEDKRQQHYKDLWIQEIKESISLGRLRFEFHRKRTVRGDSYWKMKSNDVNNELCAVFRFYEHFEFDTVEKESVPIRVLESFPSNPRVCVGMESFMYDFLFKELEMELEVFDLDHGSSVLTRIVVIISWPKFFEK